MTEEHFGFSTWNGSGVILSRDGHEPWFSGSSHIGLVPTQVLLWRCLLASTASSGQLHIHQERAHFPSPSLWTILRPPGRARGFTTLPHPQVITPSNKEVGQGSQCSCQWITQGGGEGSAHFLVNTQHPWNTQPQFDPISNPVIYLRQ